MNKKIRAHIFVQGLVQGVFFRANTYKKAKDLGLFGWIRNLPDGRVEAIFEGEKDKVKEIIEWLKKGPMFAKIDDISVNFEDYKAEFNDFIIK